MTIPILQMQVKHYLFHDKEKAFCGWHSSLRYKGKACLKSRRTISCSFPTWKQFADPFFYHKKLEFDVVFSDWERSNSGEDLNQWIYFIWWVFFPSPLPLLTTVDPDLRNSAKLNVAADMENKSSLLWRICQACINEKRSFLADYIYILRQQKWSTYCSCPQLS